MLARVVGKHPGLAAPYGNPERRAAPSDDPYPAVAREIEALDLPRNEDKLTWEELKRLVR